MKEVNLWEAPAVLKGEARAIALEHFSEFHSGHTGSN